jgi:LysM repeat protein
MSLWTLVKILAALCVMGVMTVTAMLAWHVAVEPLGGIFERLVPSPVNILTGPSDDELVKMLESPEMPDIDPGEKSFQKAHELLALGRIDEAREKLTSIVNIHPTSPSAPTARRIIGEINLDEILSTSHMEGKQVHEVRRGDSLLGIAAKYRTTIDCMIQINSMLDLPRLQPGQKLIVVPLDFRVLIEPRRGTISLWDDGRFVRDYQVLHWGKGAKTARSGKITAKPAELGGRRMQPETAGFRAADKAIVMEKPTLQIRAWHDGGDEDIPAATILLEPVDMEELALLTRVGNEVEVR